MQLTSTSFADGAIVPGEFAFCVPATEGHVALAPNRNPHLAWHDVPAGAKSLVLICHDPDAPTVGDDVNKEGRTVPASLPRAEFIHWVLVDLPADMKGIAAGAFSEGVTPKGKAGPETGMGARQGINDYTGWFAADPAMAGDYYGYDGPCPPWNDALPHRYIFTLYAIDLPRCPVDGRFSAAEVRRAIDGHTLATASLMGRYTLNPAVSL